MNIFILWEQSVLMDLPIMAYGILSSEAQIEKMGSIGEPLRVWITYLYLRLNTHGKITACMVPIECSI